ncbi:succinoglycan biosynthesis protein exop [Natronolimnobius baerhuensis]|uniref:Succinoglycan biosynthesis protein exop n=1 Tax=Natronolimnobius baerhuensis TaxID=253108 RepID=A0A202E6Z6_9EURY|nr:lipopolysaccharide biosynthesis protein [Natronolimnobius baerhuensis]OVE84033.1 succinoglycan biosynthesis protein exop [Natronolimnobius baerhuensis]
MSHELQAGTETDDRDGEPPLEDPASDGSEASMETVPADERDALLTIAHGAVVTSGGISVQRGLMTATEFVLARALGPVAYGVYALAWRIAQILIRLVTFGSVPALQRYVPDAGDDHARQSRVVGIAYATTVGVGLLMAAGVWILAPWINEMTVEQPAFPTTMRFFGALVIPIGLVMIAAGVFRAVGSARGEVLFNKLLRPAMRLLGALVALAVGYSTIGVAGAILGFTCALAVVGIPVTIRTTEIRPTLRRTSAELRQFYNYAGPVAMSSFGKIFQNRIDVLLVGALLTAVATGIYNVVLVLVALAWIPLQAFNQLLPPVASSLYSNGQVDTLNAVYTSVTRLILTTVLPILAVLLVFGDDLLALFGPTYVAGYVPLVVYLGGVFVGSAVGATGWLLMMTDHQYARMLLDWLLAVSNVVLTYVFVLEFGLVGAALGTSLAIAAQNAIQVVLLERFEGLWPFDATFLRPLAAALVMIGVLVAMRTVLGGPLGIALGAIVGTCAYIGTLSLIGVDPRDRLVVRELLARYRADLSASLSS